MSKVFKQANAHSHAKELKNGLVPKKLHFEPFGLNKVELENSEFYETSCISCETPYCMRYSTEELHSSFLTDFPSDQSDMVCPTNAIALDEDGMASIDSDQCIACGLCLSRCPVGAISFDENRIASVNKNHSPIFENDQGNHLRTVSVFQNLDTEGIFAKECPELITDFVERLEKAAVHEGSNFKNILVRNLLVQLGCESHIRRRGDVYLRMDGIVSFKNKVGALEIEGSSEAILDAPRNILDDIAVLSSRYGINKDEAYGLIISYALANQRTEYWRVIDDIRNVLDMEIFTITVPALVLLLWSRMPIDLSLYSTSAENCSIRNAIEKNLGRKINYPINAKPIFESIK